MIERDELTNTTLAGEGGWPVVGRAVFGLGWRVMAWELGWVNGERMRVGAAADDCWIGTDWHTVDAPEHVAFCRGSMPPFVYADWLEENRIDLPPEAFALLRSAVTAQGAAGGGCISGQGGR